MKTPEGNSAADGARAGAAAAVNAATDANVADAEAAGAAVDAPAPVEVVGEAERARVLLNPLRARILEEAREPGSSAEIARRLGETPQKVNYHVTTLADAGFLRLVEERRRRNLVERRYRATARRYAISPDVLGSLGLGGEAVSAADAFSAARLLGLAALAQDELGATLREAKGIGAGKVPTLSIDAEVRFASAAERSRFAEELRAAVLDVVERCGAGGRGWPFRLILGCYPLPEGDSGDE